MKITALIPFKFVVAAGAFLVLCAPLSAQKLQYPETKKSDQVDTYFDQKIADPYRWLENENAPETISWVEEQNKVTFSYLEKFRFASELKRGSKNF